MAAAAALASTILGRRERRGDPALDGSAKPFVDLLYSAGAVNCQFAPFDLGPRAGASRRRQSLARDHTLRRVPHHLHARQPAPVVGCQVVSLDVSESVFVDELASPGLRLPQGRRGHAEERAGTRRIARERRGGRQALGPQRQSPVRDEFVRHKMLDLVGDLWLWAARSWSHHGQEAGTRSITSWFPR